MKTSTRIYQDCYKKWIAKTELALPDSKVLTISTRKNDNGYVVTRATVAVREGSFLTHTVFKDFSQMLDSTKYARVTRAVIEKQHENCLASLDNVLEQVSLHYLIK